LKPTKKELIIQKEKGHCVLYILHKLNDTIFERKHFRKVLKSDLQTE